MATFSSVPSLVFTLAGSEPGLVDFRKKASVNGGTPGPIVTRSVPALVAVPVSTTPAAPTFTGFDDAANLVTIVPATGVPMSLVVYALPGSSTFQPAPSSGQVSVGNVAGALQAKSLAGSGFNASAVASSQAFTVATVTPTSYSSTQSYTTTAQDYQTKFGSSYVGTYTGTTRSSSATSTTSQVAADSQALVEAKTQAIAAMTQQVFSSTQSYTTTTADFTTKCGSGTTGTAITKSATVSGYPTQSAADGAALSQAKSEAIANLVCPVTTPTFNTTYNPGDNISTATWNAAPGVQLLLNLPLSTNTAPNPATMLVYAPDGTQIGQFDFNGADTSLPFGIVYNGQTYASSGMKLISDNITISK